MNFLLKLIRRNKTSNIDSVFNSIRINALVEQLDNIGAIDKNEYERNVANRIHKLVNGGN